jgi:hypothetical protein
MTYYLGLFNAYMNVIIDDLWVDDLPFGLFTANVITDDPEELVKWPVYWICN